MASSPFGFSKWRALLLGAGVASSLAFAQAPAAKPAPAAPAPAPAAKTGAAPAAPAVDGKKILEDVDRASLELGDTTTRFVVEETQGPLKVARELIGYGRQKTGDQVLLVGKPKTEAGGGYLRLDHNLWSYDAKLGRWERRTEREELVGTNLRRSDLGADALANAYDATDEGEETIALGKDKVKARKLMLKAKPGVDVSFPMRRVWVVNNVIVKGEDYALSGKLLRTFEFASTMKVPNPAAGHDSVFPKEVRIADQIRKDRKTTLVYQQVELKPITENVFTKAWFEGKSR